MFDTVEQQSGSRFASDKLQQRIASLLSKAYIQIFHGRDTRAQAWDLQVLDKRLFNRILGQGTLGLGEAYMDGWWECDQLDEFFSRVLSADLAQYVTTWSDRWFFLAGHLLNKQIGKRLRATAADHYNTGNDLYQAMLDPRMIYSCGYWQDAENLAQAQEHKLELVARKLKLEPGMKILDIGCGWGGAAEYMATHHQVSVVGITLSEQQHALANNSVDHPDVEIRLQDFRNLEGKFDRIYSIGMFEHVGFKNYQSYFDTVDRCLTNQGLFLLHTIGHRITSHKVDPWMNRYVFPNSILPSAELINQFSSSKFTLEDWHNFGPDYHRTLLAWDQNCQSAWPELSNYDKRFRRMWHYFLMCSAGSFKARRNHLWQIVFSKGTKQQPYQAIRSAL